jgi:hypothetical protein
VCMYEHEHDHELISPPLHFGRTFVDFRKE